MAEGLQRATAAAHGLVLGATYRPRREPARGRVVGAQQLVSIGRGRSGGLDAHYVDCSTGQRRACLLATFRRWVGEMVSW